MAWQTLDGYKQVTPNRAVSHGIRRWKVRTVGLAADTYTFLFTDIVGSTDLMQSAHGPMLTAVERHDAIVCPLLEAHGGHIFKSLGDGFLTAFASPVGALSAAVAVQQTLGKESWDLPQPLRARMALHTGSAKTRRGDYFGLALSRTARLMEIAYGGQVLLTEAAQVCMREALPRGVSLRDLGAVRLRSLERAERVYQAVAAGLSADFPALRSKESIPHNLKDALTSFVGREHELDEITELCRKARLVTLTGPGGCGKTRLARHAAQDLLSAFPDGVWLVELAGLTDPAAAVASVLKVRQEGGETLEEALVEFLQSRRLLLILDNCEHLVDACALLVRTLLTNVPSLNVLATSRERLNLAGENAWSLPPLTPPVGTDTADSVLRSSAGALFVERVSAVAVRFRLSAGNARPVAEICRRLEGMPLALELAAAWAMTLSVEQIAARLNKQLRLPPGGTREVEERHRTLHATLDWSYDLLTEPERALLRRLSVFSGGWTLEAAEAVCAGAGIDSYDVLNLPARLVDKSLAWKEEQGESVRYRMLETLRVYSLEKLRASAEPEDWHARHAAYFLDWAESAAPHWQGTDNKSRLDATERDLDNFTAALHRFSETDGEAFQRMANALFGFWYLRRYLTEGRMWLEQALERTDASQTVERSKAINRVGLFALSMGDLETASARFQESLRICRILGSAEREGAAVTNLARVAMERRDFAAAKPLFHESLALFRRLGDSFHEAFILIKLGENAAEQGDERDAMAWYAEAEAVSGPLGNEAQAASIERCRAQSLFRSGKEGEAGPALRRSLIRCGALEDQSGIAALLTCLASIALSDDDPIRAARLLAASRALPVTADFYELHRDAALRERVDADVRARLTDDVYQTAWREGAELTMSAAVAYALEREE